MCETKILSKIIDNFCKLHPIARLKELLSHVTIFPFYIEACSYRTPGIFFLIRPEMGIRGPIPKWFTSYLENKKQSVHVNGEYSNPT